MLRSANHTLTYRPATHCSTAGSLWSCRWPMDSPRPSRHRARGYLNRCTDVPSQLPYLMCRTTARTTFLTAQPHSTVSIERHRLITNRSVIRIRDRGLGNLQLSAPRDS